MDSATEQAAGFGYKCGWLAIRSSDPNDVIARLGIREARMTPWREGIESAYEGYDERVVYVTPVIDGWVLVAGTSLFSAVGELAEDQAKFPGFVTSLSASLGTVVQYFATQRVSEAHAWIFADKGRLVRAFSVGEGEVAFDQGDRTPAEKELGEWQSDQVDEEMVLRVAARWSLNPSTLEQKRLPRGWLGTYRP
jgi:hypothetical protein